MKILVAASLYPKPALPTRGLFVRERVRHTARLGHDVRVVAPVPWFPGARYDRGTAIPAVEDRDGLSVAHPRFLVIPGVGAPIHGRTYLAALRRGARAMASEPWPDVVDAHYLYPDGYAAVLYARRLGLPVVVSARGTDVNVIANDPLLRPMVRFALRHADRVIAVSDDLRTRVLALGADPARVRTISNGIDATRFAPGDRGAARRRLGLAEDATLLLSVGNLVRNKGHRHVVGALSSPIPRLQSALLWIVGEGNDRDALTRQIAALGLGGRVRLLGARPPEELPDLYAAADLFCLATEREGWPNAIVEALACGLPVVATRTGGVPELISDGERGIMMTDPAREMPDAISRALEVPWERARIAAWARRRTWSDVALEVEQELEAACAVRARGRREGGVAG